VHAGKALILNRAWFGDDALVRAVPLRSLVLAALAATASRRAYRLVASGALTVDVGVGRRIRALGPVGWEIRADPETVFDVVAGPYLGPTPRALAGKLEVWERGSDMVLAAHHTEVRCGVATTVETVRFTRPERIDFRVVRGPVPHLVEAFRFEDASGGATRLIWAGELGTDLGPLGAWWGGRVAQAWERAVRESLLPVIQEAERRAGAR
jgi:Polyketide cyclase / dehydrase and lipid transport